MFRQYFISGNRLLAFNAKCGSSSLVRGIIRQHYPAIEKTITEAHYPEGKTADTDQHHALLPFRVRPDRPVVQVVRCPVERFRSAMAQCNLIDADKVLHELEAEDGWGVGSHAPRLAANIHFLPQRRFEGDITFFRFSDQLQDAAEALGIHRPLLRIHASKEKPSLTLKQEHAVRDWYAQDVLLWESIQS